MLEQNVPVMDRPDPAFALPPVAELLTRFRGSVVYFDEMDGNHGDRLIAMGSRMALDGAAMKVVADPKRAELCVIVGGGGLNNLYRTAVRTVKRLASGFPDKPLLILPQTVWFTDPSRFVGSFADRSAPAFVYAREEQSLEQLRKLNLPGCVKAGVDHDMAFQLRESRFLRRLEKRRRNSHILVIERTDAERTSEDPAAPRSLSPAWIPGWIRRALPRSVVRAIDRPIVRSRATARAAQTTFALESVERVRVDYPRWSHLPTVALDISHGHCCTFQEFCRLIAKAAVIVTNRLHPAILGTMLEKPVYLAANTYYKNRAVYEFSLKSAENVRWLG